MQQLNDAVFQMLQQVQSSVVWCAAHRGTRHIGAYAPLRPNWTQNEKKSEKLFKNRFLQSVLNTKNGIKTMRGA